jgi:hypothetical protein
MRRKERSGPGIMNSDEFGTTPSGGEVAAASDGFEAFGSAELTAFADQDKEEKTSATTRRDGQRGTFTEGYLFEPVRLTHPGARRGEQGV